jgi:hypothetical protein
VNAILVSETAAAARHRRAAVGEPIAVDDVERIVDAPTAALHAAAAKPCFPLAAGGGVNPLERRGQHATVVFVA